MLVIFPSMWAMPNTCRPVIVRHFVLSGHSGKVLGESEEGAHGESSGSENRELGWSTRTLSTGVKSAQEEKSWA